MTPSVLIIEVFFITRLVEIYLAAVTSSYLKALDGGKLYQPLI